MATIHVSPSPAMVDEKLTIILTGLDVGMKVTIKSFLVERRFTFEAHAQYVADRRGEVNLTEQPSLGGSYTGIEPMGLFWGMQSSPGQKYGIRYMKADVTMPATVTLSLYAGHLDTQTLHNNQPISTFTFDRWYMSKDVERIPIRQGIIRGFLFKPKGCGQFPGVIDMFGGAGGCIQIRAALLASHGFAALALALFRYDDLPQSAWEIDKDYVKEAIDWLSDEPYIQAGGIGINGVSAGSLVALAYGAEYPDKISCVVSISSVVAWFPFRDFAQDEEEPIGCINWYVDKAVRRPDGSIVERYCAQKLTDAPENAIVKVENARNILFIIGEDDDNWPTDEHVAVAIDRLKAHGHHGYKLCSYPGAGHLIEPPYAPTTSVSYLQGSILAWGGTPKPHADAMEDSWKQILTFLSRHVGRRKHYPNYQHIKSAL